MRLFLVLALLLVPTALLAEQDLSIFEQYSSHTVQRIHYSGYNVTKRYVIAREVRMQEGDTLDLELVAEDIIRLENLSIFSNVEVFVRSRDSTSIDLNYMVSEMPWIIPYPALSYTEQNGWSLGLGASTLNLLGRVIQSQFSFLVGGTTQFTLAFKYPWMFGNHVSLDASLRHIERQDDLNMYFEKSNAIRPWLGTYLGNNGRLKGMVGFANVNSRQDSITLSNTNSDYFVEFAGSIGLDTRDSWRIPHDGWKNEILIQRNVNAFGTPGGGFWYTLLDVRRFQPIAEDHTLVMAGLFETQSGILNENTPQYALFYMGGSNSIRGYDLFTLGPELNGLNELILTTEYRYLLSDIREYRFLGLGVSLGWQLAAFADAGTAWSIEEEWSRDRFKIGVGVGVRLLIPGQEMIRFDFGMGESGKILFQFGTGSKLEAQRKRIR